MSAPLAHSGGHLLVVYLQSVAGLAAKSFVEIDAASNEMGWAYLAGLWHDLDETRLWIKNRKLYPKRCTVGFSYFSFFAWLRQVADTYF